MAHLGILSLDTAFPRIPGDAGNPASYPCDARVRIVERADASQIVADQPPSEAMTQAFIRAAQDLEADGAAAIVSTCGFLIHIQPQVARAVRIPVMLSALSLYPLVQTVCPGRIGVLTASATALGSNALTIAGAQDAEIAGMDHHPLFRETFLATKPNQRQDFAPDEMQTLVLQEAKAIAGRTSLSAIIFECGNLPPYASAVRETLGQPVFTILDAAAWLLSA